MGQDATSTNGDPIFVNQSGRARAVQARERLGSFAPGGNMDFTKAVGEPAVTVLVSAEIV